MKTLLCLFVALLVLPTCAEDLLPNHDQGVRKIATYSFNVSATTAMLSLSIPANSSRPVYLVEAAIESSVAFSAAQNLNGTVSGGTPVTPVALNAGSTSSVASAASGASVIGGSALPSWEAALVASKYRVSIPLEHIAFRKSASAQSYSISTGSITGTGQISIVYIERN